MVKHTQTIRRLHATNCLSLFDHFAVLALKGLNNQYSISVFSSNQDQLSISKIHPLEAVINWEKFGKMLFSATEQLA